MADLIEEIREEIKQDAIVKTIKKYGKYLLVVALAIIIATIVYVYTSHKHIATQENLSTQYHKIINGEDGSKDYNKMLAILLNNKDNIYGELAIFKQAEKLANQQEKRQEAIKMLAEIVEKAKHSEIKSLTKIKIAQLTMQYEITEQRKPAIAILQNTKTTEPMSGIINLLLAQMFIEDHQENKAMVTLKKLYQDSSSSENIRFFAKAMMESLEIN